MKIIRIDTLIDSLSDELNVQKEAVEEKINEVLDSVRALKDQDEIKLAGIGIFKRDGGNLVYTPDPVLDLEINYEFAGQQSIILAEGSGSFFPATKTGDDDTKSKSGDEFINVSAPDEKPRKTIAFSDEDEEDEDQKEKPDSADSTAADDVINVVPDDKVSSRRFDFSGDEEPEVSDTNKSKVNDEEKEKAADDTEPEQEDSGDDTTPDLTDEIEETDEVIPPENLQKIDEGGFGDEDDKASDELAVEFTTLLKKMRDKAEKASDLEKQVEETDEAGDEISAEEETDVHKPYKPKPEPESSEPEEVEEEKEPAQESVANFEESEDKNSKYAPDYQAVEPESIWRSSDASDSMPSLRKESGGSSGSSRVKSTQTDTSTIGIILVILILLIGIGAGFYFSGAFGDEEIVTEEVAPIGEDDLPPLPDATEPDPEPVEPVTEPEPVAPQPAGFEYGLRGSFDTAVTDFYGIITASVSDRRNADGQSRTLSEAGFRTHVYSLRLPDGRTTWRVVVGQFEDADSARAAVSELPAQIRNNYFVTNVRL